jgi:hypothetical protein
MARTARKHTGQTTSPAQARSKRPKIREKGTLSALKLKHALQQLVRTGELQGRRSKKLSARVDPGLIKAAKARTGITNDSDLVNAALAVIAAGDDFGPWLVSQAGRLPDDFELAI